MSESDNDVELDPRIQIELEKLNITTDEINKLEIEYDVSDIFITFFWNKFNLILGGKHNFSDSVK